jgi:hypothetical protein|eukprot:COSAG01_NODE_13354_length_1596_cov_72.368069_1_plen_154_part_10
MALAKMRRAAQRGTELDFADAPEDTRQTAGIATHPLLRKPGPKARLAGFQQRYRFSESAAMRAATTRAAKVDKSVANELGGMTDLSLWGAASRGDVAACRRCLHGGVLPDAAELETGRTAVIIAAQQVPHRKFARARACASCDFVARPVYMIW